MRNHLAGVFDQWKIRPIWYVPLFLLAPTLSFLNHSIQRSMGLALHAGPANVVVMIPPALRPLLRAWHRGGGDGRVMQRIRCRRAERADDGRRVGLVTSLWHLVPLVKMGHSALWIAWWPVWSVPLRIFILWVYNNTAKSLFAA